jgi:IS30 family transposase
LNAKLKRYWSPEAIVGRYKKENPNKRAPSFQSIYYGIRHGLLPKDYANYLRRKGRKRNAFRTARNGKLSVEHVIQERPEVVNRRERLGDWESDSFIGKKNGACLATHVDRRSRYLVAAKLPEHKALEYFNKTIEALGRYAKCKLHTMTVDRGMEFSCYKKLEAHFQEEGLTVYFADPNAPWQRGSNENTNGLLRQYIPKGMDITPISIEKIQAIVDELNNRPRKVLGWSTPAERFFG